jgi:UDP-N-acetylglucosamine 1-carboxyvinyltransferase
MIDNSSITRAEIGEIMKNTTILIEGGTTLTGEVSLSGAKNAALPLLTAACLGNEPTTLENVPVQLNDVRLQIQLLQAMGAQVDVIDNTVICSRGNLTDGEAPPDIARKVRYSLLLLGLFAALRSKVFLPQPGGCNIGDRKYDLHLMGLRKLGASVVEGDEGISLSCDGLDGASIDFYLPTTSGTENLMIAAALATGTTMIRNANTRPEVQQLGRLLSVMGADVTVQSRIVKITGVNELRGGARLTVMPGWDEAVTYMVAAGVTEGEIVIKNFNLNYIQEDARYLRAAGVNLFEWGSNVYVSGKGSKQPFDLFTAPYPGVNSDMQPIFAVLALTAPGVSTITDLRFTDRFRYVEELRCFGADIEQFGNVAIVRGGIPLTGCDVFAPDLRGGMACVLAGLTADGATQIANAYQIERGYEQFVDKLAGLGAQIKKDEQ